MHLTHKMNKTLKAYAIYTGGMIGVGIFGIPYALMRSGAWPTLVTGAVVICMTFMIHLFAVEVILMAKGKRQLPGYIGLYLGKTGKVLETIACVGGSVGALLAYLIVGGSFLVLFLSHFFVITPITATLIYFVCASSIVLWGKQGHPVVHMIIYGLFVVVLLVLIWFSVSLFSPQNIPLIGNGLLTPFLLPYGVLLFAFWGVALTPELVELTQGNRKIIRKALVYGFATALISYVIFSILIVGISGVNTTEDAIGGLRNFGAVGQVVIMFGALFGVLTTFSSFLSVGRTLKRTMIYDFKFSNLGAWAIAMGLPLLLFVAGVNGFVKVLGVTGAVFLGLEGILVVLAYWVANFGSSKRSNAFASRKLLFVFGALLTVGVVVEILRVMRIF
jgi:amino acid permease